VEQGRGVLELRGQGRVVPRGARGAEPPPSARADRGDAVCCDSGAGLARGRARDGGHPRADPEWTPLLVEFWTHASRREELRARASAAHEQLLDVYAGIVAEIAARDGLEFVVPVKAVCRGAAALARGLVLERVLDPSAVSDPEFEEQFCAYFLSRSRAVAGPTEHAVEQ